MSCGAKIESPSGAMSVAGVEEERMPFMSMGGKSVSLIKKRSHVKVSPSHCKICCLR